jgi:integrin beta 3
MPRESFMSELDVEKFIAALHGYLERELEPFAKRLKAIEEKAPIPGPPGDKGPDGKDGKDGFPGPKGLDGRDGTDGPPGEKGLDGKDGKAGLPGEKGLDGKAGEDGKDGLPGEKGLDGKDGRDGLQGEKGLDGKDGKPGPPGEKGLDGKDGKDGVGIPGPRGERGENGESVSIEEVRSAFEGEIAKWALEFERRAQDVMQKAIDRIPQPIPGKDGVNGLNGKDGKDGLGFEDLNVIQTDERNLVFKFARDGKTKEFPLTFPVLIDKGVFKPESAYSKGDGVTYAGSFWICQKDQPGSKPGEDGSWRLAVKRGRDAKSDL